MRGYGLGAGAGRVSLLFFFEAVVQRHDPDPETAAPGNVTQSSGPAAVLQTVQLNIRHFPHGC